MISIIDYNAGNIHSICNMLKRLGISASIAGSTAQIMLAERLILPGVGHFDYGMKNLNEAGLTESLRNRVLNDMGPFLGICLGAQLMGKESEEGCERGLGLIDMEVVKFDSSKFDKSLKVPHMGWSDLTIKKSHNPLFIDMHTDPRFYFVHAYHFKMSRNEDILATSNHGYTFTSAFQKDNIYGVQFHPEKSHKYGMKLLENFAKL